MTLKHGFCACDLDLDLYPITLIYELNLNILKMYPHTEVSRSRLSIVSTGTGLTDRQTRLNV